MKNILISIVLLLGPAMVFGQEEANKMPFMDRLVPHFGYTLSFLQTTDTFSAYTGSYDYSFNSVGLGSYVMLAHHNDWASVGADVGLNLGINFGNVNNRLNWQVQAPILLMGRIGAAATAYNSQKLGLGMGIGGTFTYLNYENQFIEQKDLWFHPTAVAEVNIASRQSMLTLRGGISLGKANGEGNTVSPFGTPGYSVETGGPLKGRLITLGIQYGF